MISLYLNVSIGDFSKAIHFRGPKLLTLWGGPSLCSKTWNKRWPEELDFGRFLVLLSRDGFFFGWSFILWVLAQQTRWSDKETSGGLVMSCLNGRRSLSENGWVNGHVIFNREDGGLLHPATSIFSHERNCFCLCNKILNLFPWASVVCNHSSRICCSRTLCWIWRLLCCRIH